MIPVDISEEDIARRLAEVAETIHPPEAPIRPAYPSQLLKDPPRPAAVLVPLACIDHSWHILFTRRTDSLPEHSGQVAFPGGRSDPGDLSPEATALREAQEEIGLSQEKVRLLGRLDSFVTNTNYVLTPIVGAIDWPFTVRLELQEVQRVFTIPLAWLAEPGNHETRLRQLPPPFPPIPVIYFQAYDNEVLWGVSANITVNLIKTLFE